MTDKTLDDLLNEMEERCKGAELPWHVGHISEANPNRMDVDTEINRNVADDTLQEYASFMCSASYNLPRLVKALRVAIESLETHRPRSTTLKKIEAIMRGEK